MWTEARHSPLFAGFQIEILLSPSPLYLPAGQHSFIRSLVFLCSTNNFRSCAGAQLY